MKQGLLFHILESSSHTQPPPPTFFLTPPPPPIFQGSHYSDLEDKISPSILLIIIILAIIFFVSGMLHLLVRFLLRPNNRDPDEVDNVTALQGQLQQLFHLHDSGVDQSFIDTLPVFHYKAIIGVKDPFDCAVCLCEFEPEDKLRLLPKCSHAFHMDCIDTWLLSHSTCPLCRSNLLDFSEQNGSCTPFVCVLESGSESSREINVDRDGTVFGSNRHLGSTRIELPRKSTEISVKDEVGSIVTVKLGKFKNVDGAGESSSSVNSRRCYSMGSFAYVMDDNSSFQVPIRSPEKKASRKKKGFLPLKPGHRSAVSEYGSDSRRELAFKSIDVTNGKSESFSISKIWNRGEKKEKGGSSSNGDSSKRAFSFRLPMRPSERSISEVEFGEWENNGGSEMGTWGDEETQSCYSVESQAQQTTSSSTRRTLLWLMGRQQNKGVHPSISSNV